MSLPKLTADEKMAMDAKYFVDDFGTVWMGPMPGEGFRYRRFAGYVDDGWPNWILCCSDPGPDWEEMPTIKALNFLALHKKEFLKNPRRKMEVHIRWMIRRDWPAVLKIERTMIEEELLAILRQRNCIGMVAEHEEKIVGFMIYELLKKEVHVLKLAVHADHRRCKIGSQLVDKMYGKLSSHRRTCITVAVRERSLEAQLFFRNQGFQSVGTQSGYYEDTGEDAFLMVLPFKGEE